MSKIEMPREARGRYSGFEIHPAAAVFPEMVGEDFQKLVESIRQECIRQPLMFHQGKLLDGRNRARAAYFVGIPAEGIPTRSLPDDVDPYKAAWDLNAERRHLTPAQKAEGARAAFTNH